MGFRIPQICFDRVQRLRNERAKYVKTQVAYARATTV